MEIQPDSSQSPTESRLQGPTPTAFQKKKKSFMEIDNNTKVSTIFHR